MRIAQRRRQLSVGGRTKELNLEKIAPVLQGRLHNLPPMASKVVRIFISSTFSGESRTFQDALSVITHYRLLLQLTSVHISRLQTSHRFYLSQPLDHTVTKSLKMYLYFVIQLKLQGNS